MSLSWRVKETCVGRSCPSQRVSGNVSSSGTKNSDVRSRSPAVTVPPKSCLVLSGGFATWSSPPSRGSTMIAARARMAATASTGISGRSGGSAGSRRRSSRSAAATSSPRRLETKSLTGTPRSGLAGHAGRG